ncbi:armadillo-type protein [Baffinella frigidus]|nr:armadillo-type protein [Cryptophyta sp. CCMP2293]
MAAMNGGVLAVAQAEGMDVSGECIEPANADAAQASGAKRKRPDQDTAAEAQAWKKIKASGQLGEIVDLMKANEGAAGVQKQGCKALRRLCANDAANQVKVAAHGGIEAILAGMRAHTGAARVQTWGCEALAYLCRNTDNQVKIAALGGIEEVMAGMRAHKDAGMQEAGCRALGYLCTNTADNEVAQLFVIDALIAGMHAGAARVQVAGFRALSNLAQHDFNKIMIAGLGGIEAVLAGMRAHSGVAEVQAWGCGALGFLCANAADSQVKVAELGGIEEVLAGMCAHAGAAAVQEAGCGVLSYLCANAANQAKVQELSVVEAVLAGMWAHRSVAGVQQQGCRAIWVLAMDAGKSDGCIEAVFAGMCAHPGASGMQLAGCRVLRSLCANTAIQVKVAAHGGIEAVLVGMDAHTGAAGVQAWGCAALSSLCANNADNTVVVAGLRGIEAVVMGMRAHADAAWVQAAGCDALCNLCVGDAENKARVAKLGGVEAVLAGMAVVQKHECRTLRQLCANALVVEVVERARAAHPWNSTVQDRCCKLFCLMQKHVGAAGVQEAGFKALARLCFTEADNLVKVPAHGAIEAVLAGMRAHAGVAGVQGRGCEVLRNLCTNYRVVLDPVVAANRVVVERLGGIEVVESARAAHPSSFEVDYFGECVLKQLRDGAAAAGGAAS